MIPLRDVIPSRTTPFVTVTLIALNAAVFAWGRWLGAQGNETLLWTYGLVPADLTWLTLLTSMFLHGGWVHILSNLMCLWIFGDNVEDRLGHGRFIFFYLLTGVVAGLAQVWWDPLSEIPLVGASGAIAGVMGAYLVMFPHSRVLVLVFFFFFLDIVEIPALLFLGLWFLLQLVSGVGSVDGSGAMIAYWAHIGGFVSGVAGVFLLRRRERESPDWWTGTGDDGSRQVTTGDDR
jgi:membrane associated rhomboid family serine protease